MTNTTVEKNECSLCFEDLLDCFCSRADLRRKISELQQMLTESYAYGERMKMGWESTEVRLQEANERADQAINELASKLELLVQGRR